MWAGLGSPPDGTDPEDAPEVRADARQGQDAWFARRPVDDFGDEVTSAGREAEPSVVDDFGNELQSVTVPT